MAKKKHEEEAPAGAPEWIVTFSDMVSLLVTFFVMLMSFSTISARDTMVLVEAFNNSRGGMIESPGGPDAVDPPPNDRMRAVHPRRGADSPHTRPDEELHENLEEMGQRADEEHVPVDLSRSLDGLRIAFGEAASFAPGSAEVTPELRRSLGEIGRVLEHYSHMVVVEGHTDGLFEPTPEHPTAAALATARAEAAARSMLAQSGLSADMVQVSGLGSSAPVADEESPSGRRVNRRVEVRVLALSKARAEIVRRKREEARREGR